MQKNGGDKILTELKINEHYFIFSQGHEPLIALCFNDSWIHATVCVFLIIACGYNLAKEVFQIFDEVRGKHDMLIQSAVALSGKCLVRFVFFNFAATSLTKKLKTLQKPCRKLNRVLLFVLVS